MKLKRFKGDFKKMNFTLTKFYIRNFRIFFLLVFTSLIFQGCLPPEQTNVNTSPVNTNSSNTNIETQAKKAFDPGQAVTLPVINAMFTDDSFAQELKTKLQLTDEQINNLKTTSAEAVNNLDETGDEYSGSTQAALNRSFEEVRKIIGEEKTADFFELVRQRWNNSGADTAQNNGSALSDKPNAVPTDTRIVVNAPAYRMDIFRDGKLIKTYKIGIGYPEFPLPTGMRKAETIIFNPAWTPPDEPWVKGKFKPFEKVEAGSKDNPLGPIKIPIGSPSLIHGGKSAARLGTFASHGCVGLTNQQIQGFALDLASLTGTGLTQQDVQNFLKQKTETKDLKLTQSVPVELRYETIVVEDGKLRIFRDVYEKGTNTEENLRRVLESQGVSFDSLKPEDRENILQGLEKMAYDATGEKVEPNENMNANTNSAGKNAQANQKNANSSGKVTKNIKGQKEVTFELAELKGKGYPAPVNMAQ